MDDIVNLGYKALYSRNPGAAGYYRSGADQEVTLAENMKAFRKLRLRPRMLCGVSHRDQSVIVLRDQLLQVPVGIAPSAMQKLAHPQGEKAMARAAQKAGSVMILSTLSTISLEEVRQAAPKANLWLQLYVFKDRQITRQLVRRAEKAGYNALVLTVDVPRFGHRVSDIRNHFSLPKHLRLGNFQDVDLQSFNSSNFGSGLEGYANSLFDSSLTWRDLQYLRSITSLPVVVKGVMTAEDALLAKASGASAIFVSNHGGRQLDGVAATIEVLPEVVAAVGKHMDIYLDGGVMYGTDVIKALAIGAKAVFVGRPALWSLSYKGQKGVTKMFEIFKEEIDRTLALMGCRSTRKLDPSMVVRRELYNNLWWYRK
ncbi:hydroxyacid oxidase 1 [Ixodes scapularis]|uniref:hydroxyacid oxidase 1 n=1 Tax=Ixodes scapularis TaxID=6945 RepID=UPI001A9E726E|nr:hydroxyacid oxidase 1 [Ixodes scapularis]